MSITLIFTVFLIILLALALVALVRATRKLEAERVARTADATERKGAYSRAQTIVEVSRILESSLDYEKTFSELCRFLAASACRQSIVLVQDEEGLQRVAEASSNSEAPGLFDQKEHSGAITKVLRTGRSECTGSCALIPIPSRARISGILVLISESASALDSDDVRLFEEIGRRTGLALEHARLYRQAQEANRMKDEFVAIVSHELRTPLTPILGAVYMLRTEPNDPRIAARALDLIERNAKAQSKIVEDLLDVSRIISGKLRLNMETVDLHTVINSAVETVRPASDAKSIRLDVELSPLNGVVYGDADRLQQVVWNLLANAVKFTPNGGTIALKLNDDNTHAEMKVSDTGIGIGEEFLPHVFDRFRQADASRTRTHGGLGLGLAIVRHLVESHGGTVHADSSGRERGSTFTVKLPLRPALQEARKASAGS